MFELHSHERAKRSVKTPSTKSIFEEENFKKCDKENFSNGITFMMPHTKRYCSRLDDLSNLATPLVVGTVVPRFFSIF
jgi:hypothetical protein